VGSHSGWFTLRTRCDPGATPSPVPLTVDVVDRVAIIPNPVSIAPGADGKMAPERVWR